MTDGHASPPTTHQTHTHTQTTKHREIALGLVTAVVVASESEALADEVCDIMGSEFFRVFTSTDVVGVEIGGAVKNVIAIAVRGSVLYLFLRPLDITTKDLSTKPKPVFHIDHAYTGGHVRGPGARHQRYAPPLNRVHCLSTPP